MRILITRPRDDAVPFARMLAERGHDAVIAPLLEIHFPDGAEISLDGVQAILATSANGVRAIARRTQRRDVALFAVGPQTAEAAQPLGFATVRNANGDGAALARAAGEWASPHKGVLLHAAGNVFVRTLGEGETILIKPTALVFKDPTVQMHLHFERPGMTFMGWGSWANRYTWLRLIGPGRVAVQSDGQRRVQADPERHLSTGRVFKWINFLAL